MEAKTMDINTLFSQYLTVCNAALDKHKDDIPYKQLIRAGEKLLEDRKLGIAVYKDEPSKPFDYFTVRFDRGAFHLVGHGKKEPDLAWKAKRSYLERVVDNQAEYIEHPAKLDFHWFRSRVGLD